MLPYSCRHPGALPGTTVTKMGVSSDGVQQFLDRLVDEALSTVDLPETTSSRPRSASDATAWVAVRQMIGRYAPSATDERSPRLSGRTEFAISVLVPMTPTRVSGWA